MRETDLYLPLKRFLEARDYEVKAEVQSCDIVARKGDSPPLIIEMKQALSLQLIYQAVDRLSVSETVFVAIARPKRPLPREASKLCRRLGLGLIMVSKSGSVEVLAEPGPYAPRASKPRQEKLLKEFSRRQGDPNLGGSVGTKLMTAYKQDALRCLHHLQTHGPTKLSDLRKATNVERAANIMRDNYYGWFQRMERGIYELTSTGHAATATFTMHISALTRASQSLS